MKIGITGSTGFIGGRVASLAKGRGWEVTSFSRKPRNGARLLSADQTPDLTGLDGVLHLAGASVFGPWTRERKREILDSRVDTTRRLVEAMKTTPPKVFVCASAIGFYGDTRDQTVDEDSPAGEGFLADVCKAWELEAMRAEALGVRVVRVRIGFVLGRDGGAMKLIAPVFKLGLGGRLGDGRQGMSGIHVDDVAGIFLWAAENPDVEDAVNAVMPEPFSNADFTREVAAAVHRPAILPAPAFALRLGLGELSHLLLDSSRVIPRRTQSLGYEYKFPCLQSALRDVVG